MLAGHASHHVLELFAKRDFRCDCCTPAVSQSNFSITFADELACNLVDAVKTVNDANRYNHNFVGRYCVCAQRYDPEMEESVMHQCFICQDWFHDRCIAMPAWCKDVDADDDKIELKCFVCTGCVTNHPWLLRYKDAKQGLLIGASYLSDINMYPLETRELTSCANPGSIDAPHADDAEQDLSIGTY
jgi:hypothetical protein